MGVQPRFAPLDKEEFGRRMNAYSHLPTDVAIQRVVEDEFRERRGGRPSPKTMLLIVQMTGLIGAIIIGSCVLLSW